MFTATDIIDIAVKIEKNGEQVYRTAASQVVDTDLAEFLKWAADQEASHAEFFLNMNPDKLVPVRMSKLEQIGRALIEDAIGEHSFSLDAEDLSDTDCLSRLLLKSIQLEEDTLIFYELLGNMIEGDPASRQLEIIMREEKNHILKLKEFTLSKQVEFS
ncbi:MAG: ferritin family protein [Desulfobacteraceae bacterium]|nr:ferritin family protein [Desulfobacteraceae bacterium]